MTSHVILRDIDENNPITTSPKVISEVIRNFLGFDGFLISDAIDMHAINGSVREKTLKALDAGVDAICYCSGKIEEMQAICEEKRFMTEKSINRFDKIKKIINNKNKWSGNYCMLEEYNNEFQEDFKCQYTYDATETLEKMLKKGEN
jgi:beta-glucosidase-like glycosyl hydrolase